MQQQQSFIFIGRYGAGKGTQAHLLEQFLSQREPSRKIIHIDPGAEFRKLIQKDSFTAKTIKEKMEKGLLMPEFLPIYIWANVLVESFDGAAHIIFDGAARKLDEAKILETIFSFYGLDKPWVVHLDVHDEESTSRLRLRAVKLGRKDDSPDSLIRRKVAFENEAMPTIKYFQTSKHVKYVDIDGIGTIEEVHARVLASLGLA